MTDCFVKLFNNETRCRFIYFYSSFFPICFNCFPNLLTNDAINRLKIVCVSLVYLIRSTFIKKVDNFKAVISEKIIYVIFFSLNIVSAILNFGTEN